MQNKSIKKKEFNGLTLIELLLVIAILAIIAGISISALGEYIPDYRLQSAARELYANMHKAKMEAIKRNSNVRIVFDVSGERYAISVEHDGNGNWDNIDENDNLKIVNLSKYEGSVRYGSGNADHASTSSKGEIPEDYVSYYENGNNIATFYRDGTCRSGRVYFANTKNKSYSVGSFSTGIIVLFTWNNDQWTK